MRRVRAGPIAAVVIALTALVGLLSLYDLSRDVGRPFGGFLSIYNPIVDHWFVDYSTPPWWSGIAGSELEVGDPLISLEGVPYREGPAALYATAHARGLAQLALTFERDWQPRSTTIPLLPFSWSHFIEIRTSDVLIGLCFWILALLVYRAGPTLPLNQIFAVSACIMAVNRWLTVHSLFIEDALSRFLDSMSNTVIGPLMGAVLIHFALSFPTPIQRFRRPVLYLVYGVTLVIICTYTLSRLLLWTAGHSELVAQLDSRSFYNMWRLFISSVLVLALRLGWLFLTSFQDPRRRQQALIVLLGVLVSTPYLLVLWRASVLGQRAPIFWQTLDLRYLMLAIPTAFAFVIVRYQTFQRASPLWMGVVIVMSSALLASLGSSLAYQYRPQLLVEGGPVLFLIFFVALVVASLFWATQSTWRGLFGRLLQRRRRSYEATRRIGRRLLEQHDPAALPSGIVRACVDELELDHAALWRWDHEVGAFRYAAQAGKEMPLPDRLPTQELRFPTQPLRLQRSDDPLPAWLIPLQDAPALDVAVILSLLGEPVGLLTLGKRWDEADFDEDDMEIVELVAQQIELFLLTAQQVDALRQVPHHVAAAQEWERRKISKELHDTVQQALGRIALRLASTQDVVWEDPVEAKQLLEASIDEVGGTAKTLRYIQDNLAPYQLEAGFAQPLRHHAEAFSRQSGLAVTLDCDPRLDDLLSLEQRHALYRFVQQVLDNAREHAQATEVRIRFQQGPDVVRFTATDDGRGFTPEQLARAQRQGSRGLRFMQQHLERLGGELTIYSISGEGTRLEGYLPIAVDPNLGSGDDSGHARRASTEV